jgi:hypothetical protein
MFIVRATSKRGSSSLHGERNVLDFPIKSGNIALRWSAGRGSKAVL